MKKTNVTVFVQELAKEKKLSKEQEESLLVALKEATSVLKDDTDSIEATLTFLDEKIHESYDEFFSATGVNTTKIKSTTTTKVNKIREEKTQKEVAQKKAEAQMANSSEKLNEYFEKAKDKEFNEADLFKLPKEEVIASIHNSLNNYFNGFDLPEEFKAKLSSDIYDAKKTELMIEERVAAGEKREDVEAEMFSDEESRLKHDADVEIYDETAEEEYFQIVETISAISSEFGITFQEAEAKFFEGKSDANRYRYMIEQGRYRNRIRELRLEFEELQRTKGTDGTGRTETSEVNEPQSYALSGFGKRRFEKISEYIKIEQNKLQFLERRLERAKRLRNTSEIADLEKQCEDCRSTIESYQKILDRTRGKLAEREARMKEDIELYEKNKVEVERLMREENLTVEAAVNRVFGLDFKAYNTYMRVEKMLSDDERSQQKENASKEVAQKFSGLKKRDVARYVANQKNLTEIDEKIAELEGFLETSRKNGNSENIEMFEKRIAELREDREKHLRKIDKLEAKSNNITGENNSSSRNQEQTQGISQLVVENMEVGGEKKKKNPFALLKDLFKFGRPTEKGVKGAYDSLAVAQEILKTQELTQTQQTATPQKKGTVIESDAKGARQEDKGTQEEPVL